MHPSEDDLILKFYGEHSTDETARIEQHLRTCPTCRDAWTELSDTLKLVDSAAVPEPPDGFERVMWAKVQQALPAPRAARWTWRQLVPAASLAAVVVALVSFGYAHRTVPVSPQPTQSPVARSGDATRTRERVLLTALDSHFEQTELLLVELLNAPQDDSGELTFERTTADDLVASGRLYRLTAEQIGKGRLAAMLDELEPVLVEVARSPEKSNRKDLQSLRSQIDDRDLLFKVRVAAGEVRERQQEITTTTHEGSL
jgi:hypothetical protein